MRPLRWFWIGVALLASLAFYQQAHIEKVNYTIYLPLVYKDKPLGMGLAWGTYPEPLTAEWYYATDCGAPCVPQWYDFTVRTDCRPVVLLGNEPDFPAPAGYLMTVSEAVAKSKVVRETCPMTRLIAGNTIQGDSTQWMRQYVEDGGEYDIVGTHCYADRAASCAVILDAFRTRFASNSVCLTEWGIAGNTFEEVRLMEFKKMLAYVEKNFRYCSAVYTDFAPAPWNNFDLLNPDLTPNPLGQIYARR